jgi:maltooligosyltrehalose trehalohydrolase
MRRFAVWAPAAQSVPSWWTAARPMTRCDGGWWAATWAAAVPGSRYGFSVDGGPVRPDPRSPSQPDGVHGLSAVVDHDAFGWTDRAWRGVSLPGSVLYELHVGTFSTAGTFAGVAEHLDHLVDLGVDAVELLPVAGVLRRPRLGLRRRRPLRPHHAYGGPTGWKRLVDACHDAGLGVIFDVVYNHLGPAENYLNQFGPYFTDRHQTALGRRRELRWAGQRRVRRFVVDNAIMWLRDYHGDGLRLDAVHAIVDTSARPILEQLAVEVDALAAHVRKPLFLIAESDRNDPALVRPRAAGGHGLAAAWADEWHHGLHTVLTGEHDGYYEDFGRWADLAKGLRQAWVHDGTYSPHRRRVHGRPVTGMTGDRFVIATCRTTTRSATGPPASASPPWCPRGSSRWPPPCFSPPRSCPCCSWARSGRPARRSSTSPTMRTPTWAGP